MTHLNARRRPRHYDALVGMTLPLEPPISPQLAKAAKQLPDGRGFGFEPKWDGFRVIAFVDGDAVFLQSRTGKPLLRYFPELTLPHGRYVLDGEIIVDLGQGPDFAALQARIHPAVSRIERLAKETPAVIEVFDLLARDDRSLLELPFGERRSALEALLLTLPRASHRLTPQVLSAAEAEPWLRSTEGVIAKRLDAPYAPGKRTAMQKIRRVRTIDCVIAGYRPGTEPETIGSLILALYEPGGRLVVVGHSAGFTRAEKRRLLEVLHPLESGERGSGDESRWSAGKDLEWIALRPVLVAEIRFDHQSEGRIRHNAQIVRFREDRDPATCSIEQLTEVG